MKQHETKVGDLENGWVTIYTEHIDTGSATIGNVPLNNIRELIVQLQKILNDKRSVDEVEKVCEHIHKRESWFVGKPMWCPDCSEYIE